MRAFKKQPSEVFDYDVEMEDWFNERDDGDEITSIESTSDPAFGADAPALVLGPTVGAITLPDYQLLPGRGGLMRRAKIWIGYGTDLLDYIVTYKIYTKLGRLEEGEFKIRVREEP